ncbi:4'-phosphopantetheinyl transferase [Paenibacillus swuensis]|uniref:Holo-[acyl-carrier-protein] synthase n=1 Tax=Paenibacillus swuensis TaxID=1178515 RepID=A0A172TEV0_9BACL|nr:holo-ACP synthase [Paenibacillus swuensis]ANE45434.1 4'-phosphopantetheinyl transferase [Paenibacillus swuensis]
MIIGIGHDVIEIRRIDRTLQQRYGDLFMRRVLTQAEYDYAQEKANGRLTEFVAGRFAAKEAVVKAFGSGIGRKTGFQDVEIMPDEQGKPVCTLSESALQRLGMANVPLHIHISITHSESLASAFSVIEKN